MILATALAAAALKPCTLPGAVVARCSRLAVREDRRLANGRKIKLFVAVVRAYGPQDPLENVEGAPSSLPNAQILVVPGAGQARSSTDAFRTSRRASSRHID
jgi:hypothetical protein